MNHSEEPEDDPDWAQWHDTTEWILVDANRLLVGAGLSLVVLLGLSVMAVYGVLEVRRGGATTIFGGFISGNLTLITIVISINQLVTSQELASPGEIRDRIDNVAEYRNEVETLAGEPVAPVSPANFLRLLLESTRQQAQRLGGLVADSTDETEHPRQEVDELVTALTRHIDRVVELVEDSDKGVFDVLSASMHTNYAKQIHYAQRIREEYEHKLSDREIDALEGIVDRLQQIDVARQYYKTLYIQEELSELTRILIYVGVPAVLTPVFALAVYSSGASGRLPLVVLRILLPVLITLALAPLLVLAPYVVRIAVVTQYTAATTQFTTPR